MLYRKPTYHPLALAALQKLADENIVCTPDEILWLHQAAQTATRLTPGDGTLLDYPLIVGNAALWPLTLGADAWLNQFAAPLYNAIRIESASCRLQVLCIAYAMAHARQPEAFRKLTARARIIWAVSHWAAGLSVTVRELSAGVDRVLGLDAVELVDIPTPKEAAAAKAGTPPAPAPRPDYSGYGEMIAQLCHFYGGSPDRWQWHESAAGVTRLLQAIAKIIPGADADDSAALALARNKYNTIVNHIRAAHKPAPSASAANTEN